MKCGVILMSKNIQGAELTSAWSEVMDCAISWKILLSTFNVATTPLTFPLTWPFAFPLTWTFAFPLTWPFAWPLAYPFTCPFIAFGTVSSCVNGKKDRAP